MSWTSCRKQQSVARPRSQPRRGAPCPPYSSSPSPPCEPTATRVGRCARRYRQTRPSTSRHCANSRSANSGATSRLRFKPVASHLTPMAMADLTGRYATALDQHLADPLVLVPLAMLDFLCIHPFPDGNGRMSRLLTLLLLYHFDYAVGRYISLERIFEETKEGYYETLEASSQGWHQGQHDAKPWLDYFWGALLRAYREVEERVGTIERGRGSKGDRVRAEVLGRCLPFSISEIEEACPGVSRDMVRLVLRAMKSEGLIESTGK